MFKSWGSAFLMASMVMAFAAPTASAVSFHSATTPEYLSAPQVESTRFRFPSTHFGEFFIEPICTSGTAIGKTSASTTEQIELVPTYSGCTTQALPVTVNANGCGYVLTPSLSGGVYKASLKIACPAEKTITIKFVQGLNVCEFFIGTQTPAESSFTLVNEGSPGQVHFSGTAKGVTYATSPESANTNCGLPNNNAEIVLNLAIKGYSDEGRSKQVSFRVE